jgi:hypothetical protein
MEQTMANANDAAFHHSVGSRSKDAPLVGRVGTQGQNVGKSIWKRCQNARIAGEKGFLRIDAGRGGRKGKMANVIITESRSGCGTG